MASRTTERIDWQKQQAAALARAQAASGTAGQTAAIQSTPPGYIEGFNVALTTEYKIYIHPGVANVAGQRVELAETYTLKPEDETVTRLSASWWYLYIDKLGNIHSDIIAPVYKSEWIGFYQPNHPWRNIGKYFVGEDHLCLFASNWQQSSEQTVYVAPANFTGVANYYCTGTDDQILINAAIQYLHGAYNGGIIHILRGSYYCSTSEPAGTTANKVAIRAFDYDNIAITGEGEGTVVYLHNMITSTGRLFGKSITLTTHINNTKIENLAIRNTIAGVAGVPGPTAMYGYYNDKLTIKNVSIKGYWTGGIGIVYSDEVSVSDCIIDYEDYDDTYYGIQISGSGDSNCYIQNNIIRNLYDSGGSPITGIIIDSMEESYVTDNIVYDIANNQIAGDANSPIGISLTDSDRILLKGNYIRTVKNAGTSTYAHGLIIDASCSNISCIGNYCYNNGSDTLIANTNSNNFTDAGTGTQVYSNSWQSPVIDTSNFTTQLSGSTVLAAYSPAPNWVACSTLLQTSATILTQNAWTTVTYTASTCTASAQAIVLVRSITGYVMTVRVQRTDGTVDDGFVVPSYSTSFRGLIYNTGQVILSTAKQFDLVYYQTTAGGAGTMEVSVNKYSP